MKIGILVTGRPPNQLIERFGDYPAMFRDLLGPGYSYASFDVAAGALPKSVCDAHVYILTGSPAGVYDDLPWIAPLADFLRSAKGRSKLVGICFGHQIMAEAFGGRVERSDKGWGIGLHEYRVLERAPWMDDADRFSIPISHQDQIVEQPPASHVLAGSDFGRFGLIAYDDQPAISFQCHPEFEPAYAQALIESRRGRLPDPDGAIASLKRPNDRERVAGWIRSFLNGDFRTGS